MNTTSDVGISNVADYAGILSLESPLAGGLAARLSLRSSSPEQP